MKQKRFKLIDTLKVEKIKTLAIKEPVKKKSKTGRPPGSKQRGTAEIPKKSRARKKFDARKATWQNLPFLEVHSISDCECMELFFLYRGTNIIELATKLSKSDISYIYECYLNARKKRYICDKSRLYRLFNKFIEIRVEKFASRGANEPLELDNAIDRLPKVILKVRRECYNCERVRSMDKIPPNVRKEDNSKS